MSGGAPRADDSPDPDERPAVGEGAIWHRIREHKIIQWSLGYLAAALALAHAEELIAHAYGWPESIGQILIALLGIGLPVAVTLAWYHGHRASRHVSGAEATIIAILLLLGAGFLWLFVRPHEPAAAQLVAERAAAATTSREPSAAVPLTPASTASPFGPASSSGKPRIAILPFENLSPDPANAFFTEGLHEEIISTLSSRAPDLEVISRTTMMTYRTPKPVVEIARELGATHVLEGSVRREGNAVRLTLQLIDARRDQHLWSHDYNRTLTTALNLESDVANEVASQISGKLDSHASDFRPPTRDPQAYDLFLKARLEIANSLRGPSTTRESLQRTEDLLTAALAHDPQFARAYAQRALVRVLRWSYNYDPPQQVEPLARSDIEAAERLAPDDPEVLAQKAGYLHLQGDDPQAAAGILEAVGTDIDPLLVAVSAETFEAAGRYDEAIARTQRALVLDPKNFWIYLESILAYLEDNRPAEALRVADLAEAEFPGDFRNWRAYIVWENTGAGPPTAPSPGAVEITTTSDVRSVRSSLYPLRLKHRYRDMADYLNQAKSNTVRGEPQLGLHPVAELRGWTHLLLQDPGAAAKDGREVLDFVAHTEETRWNRAFLQVLAAEAAVFRGEKARALEIVNALNLSAPHELRLMPDTAVIRAWAGAGDDAASFLEQTEHQAPSLELGPATIARDPLFTVPLAGNARYQALRAKLEAQMAATRLE